MLKNNFIEPEIDEFSPETEQPASYVRKTFNIGREIAAAKLSLTALGTYEGYINGSRLGSQVLTPGYTDYFYRVQYQSYDVKHLLEQGENVIAAVIGDGWYRGCIDIGSKRNCYGTKIKFACQLEIIYADGTAETIVTDESWKAVQDGMLRENNIKTIERVDARKKMPGWNDRGFDGQAWHGVNQASYAGEVIAQQGELILEHENFAPTVLQTPDGRAVLDMGQNFAGYVRFTVTGPAGHQIALTMGEVLDQDGNFTMKNLSAEGASLISGAVGQKLEYILAEGRQTYKPHFLVSGFRYVLLENWPEAIAAENFTGIAVYSDLSMVGDFTCSNELINQLVRNVRWSEKSNFVDIPGDCPTRERSGWTADTSVFAETACYLSNPRKFIKKWLQDYKYEQSSDGNLPYVVPSAGKPLKQWGCMGWSNAIANLSMVLYRFYGKKDDLENVYECVKKFVDFNVERAKKRNLFFLYKFGKHRKYIIETGFHYGEWLEPGTTMYKEYIKDLLFPDTEVTTAWFYYTTMQLVEMAKILGKQRDVVHYRNYAGEIKHAYHKEFLKHEKVASRRQCRYVRPIALGLVEGELKERVAADLNELCKANDCRIGTGFLTTYQILTVLSEAGYVDTAYRLLENTSQPGWLYAVTKGATTTWENWYGINEKNEPVDSHNHFAPGAVVAWLFSHCAGIKPLEPGFAKVLIKPIPGGTLSSAKAEYDSCRGKIVSDWRIQEGQFQLNIAVPADAPAVVQLPDGQIFNVTGGTHTYSCLIN